MNATITLKEYLDKGKVFAIPDYQRGYVWGKTKTGSSKDSVTYIMESLIKGFCENRDVFIQGVTVSESDEEIVLIDGQQRTTFFYLLLKTLGYDKPFRIKYKIRKESDDFLSGIKGDFLLDEGNYKEDAGEEFQDIYFFKKSLRIIKRRLSENDIDKDAFQSYVLEKVKFLYIDIPEDKATKVFSMMNGNKAEMKAEELIKAELLRLASLNDSSFELQSDKEKYAIEWDHNMLRSRYAREWDKWLQWWNKPDVKKFYRVESVMGLLVSTYMYLHSDNGSSFSFENFKERFLKKGNPAEAKTTFDGLRRLQKRFEDAFNTPIVYNKIGAIIRIINDRNEFIKWYFADKKRSKDELDRYYKLAFIDLTHNEIMGEFKGDSENKADFKNKFGEEFWQKYNELDGNSLYLDSPTTAFRLLLRLNIDEDNLQEEGKGRKFDFAIWDRNDSRGKSLEHIYPKSKVYHKEENDGKVKYINGNGEELISVPEGYIDRESCRWKNGKGQEIVAGEHSIGNLVLLYKDDNSSFNNSDFEEKKGLFFKRYSDDNKKIKSMFKSRHLLHTIYKFAGSKWDGEEIAKNKYQTLCDFKSYYQEFMNAENQNEYAE